MTRTLFGCTARQAPPGATSALCPGHCTSDPARGVPVAAAFPRCPHRLWCRSIHAGGSGTTGASVGTVAGPVPTLVAVPPTGAVPAPPTGGSASAAYWCGACEAYWWERQHRLLVAVPPTGAATRQRCRPGPHLTWKSPSTSSWVAAPGALHVCPKGTTWTAAGRARPV